MNRLNIRNVIWLWLGAIRRAAPVYCTRAAFSSIVPPLSRDTVRIDVGFDYAFLKEAPNLLGEDSFYIQADLMTCIVQEPLKILLTEDVVVVASDFNSINLKSIVLDGGVGQDGVSVSAVFSSIAMFNIVVVMEPLSDSCTVSANFDSINLT